MTTTAQNVASDIKDLALADEGRRRTDWEIGRAHV